MMISRSQILKKPARSVIRLQRAHAIFWRLTGDLPAPSSSRSKVKKVYFIRFLPPKSTDVAPNLGQQLFEDSLAPAKVTMSVPSPIKTSGKLPALHSMVFPKSVTITDLLKAGKLVKPPATNITVILLLLVSVVFLAARISSFHLSTAVQIYEFSYI